MCKTVQGASSNGERAGEAGDPQYTEIVSWLAGNMPQSEIRDRLAGKHVTGGREYQEANHRIQAVLPALALNALYTQADAGGDD